MLRASPGGLLTVAAAFWLLAGLSAGGCSSSHTETCVPGNAVVCVGVAACHGGQVCSADGTSYGPCECGAGGASGGAAGSGSSGSGGGAKGGTGGGGGVAGASGIAGSGAIGGVGGDAQGGHGGVGGAAGAGGSPGSAGVGGAPGVGGHAGASGAGGIGGSAGSSASGGAGIGGGAGSPAGGGSGGVAIGGAAGSSVGGGAGVGGGGSGDAAGSGDAGTGPLFALAARYSNFLPYGFCDVDGDGHLDALGGDHIGNTDVWKGRGDGTFNTTPVVTTSVAGSGIFGDVDGDGRCDLIVTTNAGTTVTMAVAHGQADATFKLSKVSIPGLKKPIIWYAGDLNHDGRLDLVVPATTAQGDLEYRTFFGQPSTPTADFSAALTVETFVASPGSAMGIQTPADVDGDGNPDIALPLIIGSSNTIAIAYGTGDGHFKTSAAPNIVGGLPTTPSLAALSDFDGDGKADVVVYSGATSPADQIFWSEGAGVFTAGPALSFTYMGDFDADGKLDVFGNAGSGNVDEGLIYLHSGPRSFRVYPNPYNSSALAVADVDGDGASDVALGTDLPGLSIFLSTAKHAGPAAPDINCSPMPASACAGETSF